MQISGIQIKDREKTVITDIYLFKEEKTKNNNVQFLL